MKPVALCGMIVAVFVLAMGAMLPTTAHAESQLKPKALVRDGTTESAPNHVAIATGMTVKKTKINWNPDLNSRGTNAKYLPTWLVRLTKARKDLKALHIFLNEAVDRSRY